MDNYCNFRPLNPFYDDTNYPRGFSKHGDFTIKEADALHHYGRAMQQLAAGTIKPESTDEINFTKFCQGDAEAKTYLERLWKKYQTSIGYRKIAFSPYGSCQKISA